MALRVVIAEDQQAFRKLLIYFLLDSGEVQICGEAGNGVEAIELVRKFQPDILLLDLGMPLMDGYEVLKNIRRRKFPILAMVLSERNDATHIIRAVNSGADGYFCKGNDPATLITAIKNLQEKGYYFDEAAQEALQSYQLVNELGNLNEVSFDERERTMLLYLCKGYSSKKIGTEFFISERTVEGMKADLFKRTGTDNSAQLIIYAVCHGIVDPYQALLT